MKIYLIILISLNIILVILNILLLSKQYSEPTSVPSVVAVTTANEISKTNAAAQSPRQAKVDSAFSKLAETDDSIDLLSEVPEVLPSQELMVINEPEIADLEAPSEQELAAVQLEYEQKANAYKQSLLSK